MTRTNPERFDSPAPWQTPFIQSGNAIVRQYPFFYEKIKMILLSGKNRR